MEECAPMGAKNGMSITSGVRPMEECTHGSQEPSMDWSTHGFMLMSIPWMDAPMGASHDQKWGAEINGSIVGSVPWMGAPMGGRG